MKAQVNGVCAGSADVIMLRSITTLSDASLTTRDRCTNICLLP
jgi:hypothetical protein